MFGPGAALVAARRALVRGRAQAARARGGAARRGAERRASARARAARSRGCSSSTGRCSTATSRSSLPRIDRYLDLSEPDAPATLDGDALRRTLADLARRPFRTLPTFLPGAVGRAVAPRASSAIETDAPNLAWSYELIAPEASILVDGLEVGFELLMAAARRDDPRPRGRGALRPLVPDPLRLPRHARRRPPLDPVPPVAGVRARDVRPVVHAGRDLLRHADDPRREASSSACATTPTSAPSSATPGPRSKAGRSSPSGTSSGTTPSGTGCT